MIQDFEPLIKFSIYDATKRISDLWDLEIVGKVVNLETTSNSDSSHDLIGNYVEGGYVVSQGFRDIGINGECVFKIDQLGLNQLIKYLSTNTIAFGQRSSLLELILDTTALFNGAFIECLFSQINITPKIYNPKILDLRSISDNPLNTHDTITIFSIKYTMLNNKITCYQDLLLSHNVVTHLNNIIKKNT